jgi:3'-phosphoadenosine 5'-phosphosulfate (PAPS) 3'-phosphatase
MDGKEILKEFELEKGYDPITTSDCELTNWLIKKLIKARNELSKLHQPTVSGRSEQCLHTERVWTIDPYDQKCHKCVKCGEYGV